MPRFFHLSVVPSGTGAQLFVKDGHGNFVEMDKPFNKFQPSITEAVEAVKEFLAWEVWEGQHG